MIEGRHRAAGVWQRGLGQAWGDAALIPVPIRHDWLDGCYAAFGELT